MIKTLEQQLVETEKKLNLLKDKKAKQETRQKIILGALVLNEITKPNNPQPKEWVLKLLKAATREADKQPIEALIKFLSK